MGRTVCAKGEMHEQKISSGSVRLGMPRRGRWGCYNVLCRTALKCLDFLCQLPSIEQAEESNQVIPLLKALQGFPGHWKIENPNFFYLWPLDSTCSNPCLLLQSHLGYSPSHLPFFLGPSSFHSDTHIPTLITSDFWDEFSLLAVPTFPLPTHSSSH